MEHYVWSKARLLANQKPADHAVLPAHDPWNLADSTAAQVHRFSARDDIQDGWLTCLVSPS